MLISVCSQVFVGVDPKTETNNTEHHTSEITVQRLVLRRGQPFKLSIKLAKPFDPKRDPLNMSAQTGRWQINHVSSWNSSFSNCTEQKYSLFNSDAILCIICGKYVQICRPWHTYITKQHIFFDEMPTCVKQNWTVCRVCYTIHQIDQYLPFLASGAPHLEGVTYICAFLFFLRRWGPLSFN